MILGGIVMKKLRKSITVILALLILMVVAAPAMFAAEDDMVVAYVQVPEDWESPCLWAWDEDGNNAFDVWPGGEAEPDPGNEDWFYCWIPSWVTNIIVNGNEGGIQTGDFTVDGGKDMWITVTSAEKVEVSYEALTEGEAPAYVEKISVHTRIPGSWEEANIWAWLHPDGTNAFAAWPGEAMTLDDSGWYTAKIPAWVNSIIINAGDGNPQTEDLNIDPQEMWIVVADDGSAEVTYDNPDLAVENITVRVQIQADWESPCLWAWSHPDGTNVYAAWPGEPLAADGDWLTLEVPGWINRVIVNGGEGSVQTADIEVDVGKDIWLVVIDTDNYSLTYEEPADTASASGGSVVPASSESETHQGNNSMTMIIIALAAVVVIVVIVILVVVRKKKKS